MSIINLLRSLAPMFKDSKTFLGTVACSALLAQWMVGYVDAKHKDGIDKIMMTQEQVAKIQMREYQSQASLSSIEKNVDLMAERMRVIDQRIWELYRDSKQTKTAEYE